MEWKIKEAKWKRKIYKTYIALANAFSKVHPQFSKKYKTLCKTIFTLSTESDYWNLIKTRMYGAHKLKGNRKYEWALNVSKNQRLIIKFIPPEKPSEKIEIVNELEDYH